MPTSQYGTDGTHQWVLSVMLLLKKYLNALKVPVPPATGRVASGLYGPSSLQS